MYNEQYTALLVQEMAYGEVPSVQYTVYTVETGKNMLTLPFYQYQTSGGRKV